MEEKNIRVRPIKDYDIELLTKWLYKDYILKWYHEPEEWIREVRNRNGEFSFLSHFIVLDDNIPFGFCQYYDCFDAQEDWYSVDIPHTYYSIDYLIGEEGYLGKGYGKEIIKQLIKKITEENHPKYILVQPEKENAASCNALLANGFNHDAKNGYYILEL